MSHIRMSLLTSALALVGLAMTSPVALAATASISPAGSITMTSSGRMSFAGSSIVRPECVFTATGSLNAGPITKTVGNSFGTLTNVQLTNCTGVDSVTALGLPWQIRYLGFEGVLPNGVTAFRLGIDATQLQFYGLPLARDCLYGGLAPLRMSVFGANPYTNGVLNGTGSTSPLGRRAGGALCPGSLWLNGTLTTLISQTIRVIP
jgi:hypothetical protein